MNDTYFSDKHPSFFSHLPDSHRNDYLYVHHIKSCNYSLYILDKENNLFRWVQDLKTQQEKCYKVFSFEKILHLDQLRQAAKIHHVKHHFPEHNYEPNPFIFLEI